jgi:hypothetical protein
MHELDPREGDLGDGEEPVRGVLTMPAGHSEHELARARRIAEWFNSIELHVFLEADPPQRRPAPPPPAPEPQRRPSALRRALDAFGSWLGRHDARP